MGDPRTRVSFFVAKQDFKFGFIGGFINQYAKKRLPCYGRTHRCAPTLDFLVVIVTFWHSVGAHLCVRPLTKHTPACFVKQTDKPKFELPTKKQEPSAKESSCFSIKLNASGSRAQCRQDVPARYRRRRAWGSPRRRAPQSGRSAPRPKYPASARRSVP